MVDFSFTLEDLKTKYCLGNGRNFNFTNSFSFFGYKTHMAKNDERIITNAVVMTGEQSDGKYHQELIGKSQKIVGEIEVILLKVAS